MYCATDEANLRSVIMSNKVMTDEKLFSVFKGDFTQRVLELNNVQIFLAAYRL